MLLYNQLTEHITTLNKSNMKKVLIGFFAITFVLFSCKSKQKKEQGDDTTYGVSRTVFEKILKISSIGIEYSQNKMVAESSIPIYTDTTTVLGKEVLRRHKESVVIAKKKTIVLMKRLKELRSSTPDSAIKTADDNLLFFLENADMKIKNEI